MDWVSAFERQPTWKKILILLAVGTWSLFVIWYDIQVGGV